MIGVRFPARAWNLSLQNHVQTGSEAHSAYYPMGTGFLSFGSKRSGREADHLPRSSTEVKECVELYIHSPNVFVTWCLVKYRDNFTFRPLS
jgi:hypothetical protein